MKTAKDLIKASLDYPGSKESNPTFDLADGDEVGNVISDLIAESEDHVVYTDFDGDRTVEIVDVWGTTADGDEWRVIVRVKDVGVRIEKEAKAHAQEGIEQGAAGRWTEIPEENFGLVKKIVGRELSRDEREFYVDVFNEVCDVDFSENLHYTLNKRGVEAVSVGVEELAKPGCDPTAWHQEAEYMANERANERTNRAPFLVWVEIGAWQSRSGNPEIFALTEADFDLVRIAK